MNPELDSNGGTDQYSVPFALGLPFALINASPYHFWHVYWYVGAHAIDKITSIAGMYPTQGAGEIAPVGSLRYE